MNKTIGLYQIVPMNDGYHYVLIDDHGNHLLEHKAANVQKRLVFDSEEAAQSYIDKYLDDGAYKPEMYFCNIQYLPDNIITDSEVEV